MSASRLSLILLVGLLHAACLPKDALKTFGQTAVDPFTASKLPMCPAEVLKFQMCANSVTFQASLTKSVTDDLMAQSDAFFGLLKNMETKISDIDSICKSLQTATAAELGSASDTLQIAQQVCKEGDSDQAKWAELSKSIFTPEVLSQCAKSSQDLLKKALCYVSSTEASNFVTVSLAEISVKVTPKAAVQIYDDCAKLISVTCSLYRKTQVFDNMINASTTNRQFQAICGVDGPAKRCSSFDASCSQDDKISLFRAFFSPLGSKLGSAFSEQPLKLPRFQYVIDAAGLK